MIKTVKISRNVTAGIYLRWWFGGWHSCLYGSNNEVTMSFQRGDVQVFQAYSVISRVERITRVTSKYSYRLAVQGIPPEMLDGYASILLAERVEQYENESWYEVDLTRGEQPIRDGAGQVYKMEFEITRKELPLTPAVYQKTQILYIGGTVADLDDGEVIAQTRQVNNIAEMQDRQTDFTASFKVRKTRAMRALFELSGENMAAPTFPYQVQPATLIIDSIEVISYGRLVLLRSDAQYYHVTIYSGNKDFFDAAGKLKLKDLALASTNHTWETITMIGTHTSDLNYLYPLMEPSNDGGIIPLTDDGDACELFGGWVWPFVKAKAIFDEIFSGQGYTVTGNILTDPKYLNLWVPIVSLETTADNRFLYSLYYFGYRNYVGALNQLSGGTAINGDDMFRNFGIYFTRYTATYKWRVVLRIRAIDPGPPAVDTPPPNVYVRYGTVPTDTALDLIYEGEPETYANQKLVIYEGDVDIDSGLYCTVVISAMQVYYYEINVIQITDPSIGYGSPVTPRLHLPDMTQADFVKLICHLFALIPEANPRDKVIKFWNFSELYDNIPQAQDWSAYLSEYDDETEFRFGDYAQSNYMRYKESDDVIKDNGTGVMVVDDETLEPENDMIEAGVSYSDEVIVLTGTRVARMNMNTWDAQSAEYKAESKIDSRIVASSVATGKTLGFRNLVSGGTAYDTTDPKKVESLPIAFSTLSPYYGSLSRMLTGAIMRRAKFNLPAVVFANFRHYIPVYISQYQAYFYVSKISNYVNGKLCAVEMIKL